MYPPTAFECMAAGCFLPALRWLLARDGSRRAVCAGCWSRLSRVA